MRVAVIYFNNASEKLKKTAAFMARGIESQGHQVKLVDGDLEGDTKLTVYDYIVVGTYPPSFFSAGISEKIPDFLANAGRVSGTKSYAFILKNGFFSSKSLHLLMKKMEKEGMFLKVSDMVSSPEEAEFIGKNLQIT